MAAKYPGSERERRIPAQHLQTVAAAIFESCGMSHPDADMLAGTLVHADLRGVHSHGVLRVADYALKFTKGGVNPIGRPRIVRDGGAVCVVDGDNSMGQIGGTFSMKVAVERATTNGIAAVAVRGSNHCGAMDYYAIMALPHDMIGIATTNAIPTMAPWGGAEKIVGLNPLSIAIPGKTQPIVLDASFGATAHGKIRVFHQKGYPIPEGWAFDSNGVPTTDAAKALEGLIQPIGQYKGVALGMITGILSTLLSGAGYGTELGNMVDGPKAGADGHFFMALNISAFEDVDRFKSRVDDIVLQMHTSRRAAGVDRLYVPGEIEFELERSYRRDGIPINDATLADIVATAQRCKVDPSPLT